MDLFSLIIVPNPAKVKIETLPRAAHEVPLLTATANRVIDMEDMTGMSGSSRTPSTVEKSPLNFSNEDPSLLITERTGTGEQGYNELSKGISPVGNPPYTEVAPEPNLEKETITIGAFVNKRRHKKGPDEVKANAPPKVLRKDHVVSHLLQISNHQLSKQVSTLQAQVTGEERTKVAFEEFKKYENDRVFNDVVSAGIAKGMSEGLKHVVEHGKAKSDSGEDAPLLIHELCPSSSQLKISVYPEVRNPKDPWSFKEEILLEDAIAANISRAKKEKKCRVVCRTHGVGSAHQATSDGVPVSVPTIAPQGLAILLAGAATQTDMTEDDASPKLFRSKSLPPMYNLD
nr:hypothetical protein [Tanacetum cinerariifolium]